MHAAGARVALLSRRGDDLGLKDGLGIECDVSDRSAVKDATAETVAEFGGLDIVVANAGVGMYGPYLELTPAHLDEMIDVNLKGTLYTASATIPHLLKSKRADFISLASVAGLRAFEHEAVYNASKFGQVGFTRSLDLEFHEQGVRCTSICPGGIATDFAMGTGRDASSTEGMMTAAEVADVVMFTVTRPRSHRMLTISLRPMIEGSSG
jgi:3-oxoacyl-[acyl-carrier protein] reductase